MSRFAGLALLAALGVLVAGCSSGRSASPPTAAQPLDIAAQLAELDRMPAPSGVNPELWGQLKSALAGSLQHRLADPRAVRSAPLADASRTSLVFNAGGNTLEWLYYSQGDYDQNGEVNIADLTPIAQHFGESSGGGSFEPASVQSVVDGDANGEINIADISPIGVNFGRSCASYNVYRSNSDSDAPAQNDAPNGAGAQLLGNLPLDQASGTPAAQRLAFSFPLQSLDKQSWYWVRPNDSSAGSGQDGTASSLLAGSSQNLAPLAKLTASSDEFPAAPAEVTLYAYTSSDPDGSIVLFELDLDGDGSFEYSDPTPAFSYQHTYDAPGLYPATLRVTDNDGATGTAVVSVSVHQPGNESPVAALLADLTEGPVPLLVHLDASTSSDPDGSIVRYEWRFGDIGPWLEGDSNGAISHVFPDAGFFDAEVRVTDNQGSRDTEHVVIQASDPENLGPIAQIDADVLSGPAPLSVSFDASGSLDTDGTIAAYEWDLNADDTVDFTTSIPQLDFEFSEKGQHSVRLMVRDNDGAASGIDSVVIEVTSGWELSEVESVDGKAFANARVESFLGVDFVARPLVAYKLVGETSLFVRRGSEDVQPFSDPVEVVNDSYFGSFDLLWVNGLPGIAYCRQGPAGVGGLCFIKANNVDGSSWGTVRELDLGGNNICAHFIEADRIGGLPVVGYIESMINPTKIHYVSCGDLTGVNWNPPALVEDFDSGPTIQSLSILDSNGLPAIACNNVNGPQIYWSRAGQADGSAWDPPVLASELHSLRSAVAASIEGIPVIFFAYNGSIMALHAVDADASAWQAPQALFTPRSGSFFDDLSFQTIDGLPALVYREQDLLRYISAQDSAASAWNAEEVIHVGRNLGKLSLTEFHNRPLVLFTRDDPITSEQNLCLSYRGS
jgi:PKD repeat protein